MKRFYIWLFLILFFQNPTCFSQPTAEELLAFRIQDGDFQPVKTANWVLDGAVKVFLPPVDTPDILIRIEEAISQGIDIDIIHTGGYWPYYPLVRDDAKSGIPPAESEMIRAVASSVHQHKIRLVFGVTPYAPVALVRQHPEWMVYPIEEDSITQQANLDLTAPEHWHLRALGLNSPYGDYLIECLAEAMAEYGFDGYSFDGLYHPFINYAPYEKELFQKESGRPFPRQVDLHDLDYRIYLYWADEKLEQWYRKLHERLRQVRADAAIYTWTTNAGRYGHFLTSPRVMSTRMNQLFDCPVQEWWLDEVNLGASVVPYFGAAYVRSVGSAAGACEPYLMTRGNPYCTESFPPHELFCRCMGAITNGAFTPLSFTAGPKTTYEVLRQIALRKPWLVHTRPLPWAALLVSEQTRQFYNPQQIVNGYLAHPLGVYRAALEGHLNLTLINDWDLIPEKLAPFRVLILANAACLSNSQIEAIRHFVSGGGGLVATCDSSRFDMLGRSRGDFALSDLFGVEYQGQITTSAAPVKLDENFARVVDDSYWAQREGIAALRWGGGDIETSELIDIAGMAELVPTAQATFKGPLLKISSPASPMKRAMILFPNAGAEHFPAAAMGPFGKGRVVYLACGLDAAYFNYGFPYQRLVLNHALQWASQVPFGIEVKAPMCVQTTFYQQEDQNGRRILVHLFNGLNTTSGHGLPSVEVPLREEAVAISGIEIRFMDYPVRQFHLEPGNQSISWEQKAGDDVVKIPSLSVHAILVAELEQ